jgi:signal transduction histidine kinase
MRLATKLALALTLGIVVVMAGYAYVQVRQEVLLFEADLHKDARLGRALRATVQTVWQTWGEARARALVEEADDATAEVAIRLVWLDTPVIDPRRPRLSPEERHALASGQTVRVLHEEEGEDTRRFTYLPLSVEGARPAAIELSQSLRRQLRFIRMSRLAIGLATVVIAVVCGLIAAALGYWFVGRPMRLLRDKARRAGGGDFAGRLSLRQHDEIAELADEINAMCDHILEGNRRLAAETDARIETLEQLRHADRLATVGQLASGVAHELGTPLSVVSARAEMLTESDVTGGEAKENARVILEQCGRMSQVIRQLLDFARRREAKLEPTPLPHVVSRTLDLLSVVAERRRVRIDFQGTEQELTVRADANQLQQALLNVVVNGIQAMPDGGRLTVRISRRDARPPGGHDAERPAVCVTVEDEGQGIPEGDLPHIFEPFFSTKTSGEGTGLGLAVAHGIVAEHGGWIDVESEVGRGSRVTICLPAVEQARADLAEAVS